jgi:TolB-like protein/Tfp pilus assembly protein PilF
LASIVPGYEYDIFISYRQKDNKYDGWVTEFVDNMKRELEATFKEDVSVYFDINPHDGLLETHDVNASLKEKLKCLVFIPIISQTYCDSKCFAWQQEFCVFNKLAKEDQFGRDIRLASGNVASRILPVKIHDLDAKDKTLLENELGGVLRSIDFIYKSAGVNRPLRANEDHPQDNLNKTYYRDQMNKVANAIKEIITALKKYNRKNGSVLPETGKPQPERSWKLKSKFVIISFIILAIFLVGYFLMPKFIKPSEPVMKSFAVLPFADLSSDESESWLTGITDVIINQLSKITEFRVLPRTATLKYKENNGKKSASEIGKELRVEFILDGSVQKQGNQIRINIQLIKVRGETLIWSEMYDKKWGEIFIIQTDIANSITRRLQTKLSSDETSQIENIGTDNNEAYRLYLIGNSQMLNPPYPSTGNNYRKAVEHFQKAIELDSSYAQAYTGLASAYLELAGWMVSEPSEEYIPLAKDCALRALKIDGSLGDAYFILGKLYYVFRWDWASAEQAFIKGMEFNPNFIYGRIEYANFLSAMGRFEESISVSRKTMNLDPVDPIVYNELAFALALNGQYKEALDLVYKSFEIDPEFCKWLLDYTYYLKGDFSRAISQWEKLKVSSHNDLTKISINDLLTTGKALAKVGRKSEASIILKELNKREESGDHIKPLEMGYLYQAFGEEEKALDFYEKAFNEKQSDIVWINVESKNDPIRQNPRFKKLLRNMEFED